MDKGVSNLQYRKSLVKDLYKYAVIQQAHFALNEPLPYAVVSDTCPWKDTLQRKGDLVREKALTKGKGTNVERIVPEFEKWSRSKRYLQETERVVYEKNRPILGLNDCVCVLTNENGMQTKSTIAPI